MLLISIVLCLNLELGNVLQIRGQFDMFQLGFGGIFNTYHFHAGSEQIKINNILPSNMKLILATHMPSYHITSYTSFSLIWRNTRYITLAAHAKTTQLQVLKYFCQI